MFAKIINVESKILRSKKKPKKSINFEKPHIKKNTTYLLKNIRSWEKWTKLQ